MTEEYNFDSSIWKMLDTFQQSDMISRYRKLTSKELSNLFRNSGLIKKIVTKFPRKSYLIGYQVIDGSGDILESDNNNLLKAFREASILARLYGKCFCELVTGDPLKPIKKTDVLVGHKIHNNLNVIGDLYDANGYRIHKSKILPFYGHLNHNYDLYDVLDDEFSDSIIQSVYNGFTDYIECNSAAKYILKNLSYLLVGIENLGNMTKSPAGQQAVLNRLENLNENRNIGRTIGFDKKYEEIKYITQSVSGYENIVHEMKIFFASESEYPYDQLFDQSGSQQLGSGIQNQLISRHLWAQRCHEWTVENWLDNYITYYGNFYRDFKVEIPFSLETSEQEQMELKKTTAERDKILYEIGAITAKEIRDEYRGVDFTGNLNVDSVIDDDNYWDTLANITIADFDNLADEVINDI